LGWSTATSARIAQDDAPGDDAPPGGDSVEGEFCEDSDDEKKQA
jgi:hypothetical protein